jgi:hypothetical protein
MLKVELSVLPYTPPGAKSQWAVWNSQNSQQLELESNRILLGNDDVHYVLLFWLLCSRMFEYIALRFESTLLDFELMEKVKSSLLSHCCFSFFWLCWAMYLMYVSIGFIYHLWAVDTYPCIRYGICLLSSFLEQPDIFRAGSLMIATRMLSTLCIHGCVYTGLMLLCAYMRYRL